MKSLLIIIHFLIFCNSICEGQNYSTDKLKKSRFPPDKFNLKKTVSEIADYGKVESTSLGFLGTSSVQYERFLKLKLNASDSELVLLTNNYNSVIKAYAFWALTEKKYKGIKQIIEFRIKDRGFFQFHNGCMVWAKRINEWYLELGKQFLTDDEIAIFQKAISK